MRAFDIRTTVIEGSLAFQMRRAAAARANECGLQIMTLPQLAARLAGGFTVPVSTEQLDLAIQRALDDGDFVELESVRTLPGMTRAVAGSLRKVWNADVELLETNGPGKLRIGELALIEERVRNHLPKAMLIPRDLRDAAIRRIEHGPRLIGPVTIDGLSFIPPVWRPLIMALQQVVSVEWRAPLKAETKLVHRLADCRRPGATLELACCDFLRGPAARGGRGTPLGKATDHIRQGKTFRDRNGVGRAQLPGTTTYSPWPRMPVCECISCTEFPRLRRAMVSDAPHWRTFCSTG